MVSTDRRLPALWWQRPQFWRRVHTYSGDVSFLAAHMWRIRELTPWSLDTALRKIQPARREEAA